jgi:hypothetical protein
VIAIAPARPAMFRRGRERQRRRSTAIASRGTAIVTVVAGRSA